MSVFVNEAKRRENALLTRKKFKAADQTAAVSARGIAVGQGKPTGEMEEKIQSLATEIALLDYQVNEAKDYRIGLEAIVKQIQANELDLQKQIAALQTEQNRLRENLGKYSSTAGEWFNRGPVLDALYTGNIKLDQIWLPDMKINYNFSSVSRYDRCIVCHRAIDKTAPVRPPNRRTRPSRAISESARFNWQRRPKCRRPSRIQARPMHSRRSMGW